MARGRSTWGESDACAGGEKGQYSVMEGQLEGGKGDNVGNGCLGVGGKWKQ